MKILAFLVHQDSSMRSKIGDFSIQESFKSITLSIQTLIEIFKVTISEKKELEYRYMSNLMALFPLLTNQDFDSSLKKIHDVQKRIVRLK